MNNTSIGIDTLFLKPEGFRFEKNFGAEVTPPSFHSRDGTVVANDFPLFTVQGKKHSGRNAKLELRTCALVFLPHYDRGTKGSKAFPKITINVPKVLSPDNYLPADREQLREALGMVQAELAENGFIFDIESAVIQRLDAARTFQARDVWSTYVPLMAVLKPSRMKGTIYPSGQLWANKSCAISLYEKGVEIASHYKDVLKAEVYSRFPSNSIRAEIRWMKRASFNDATGMATVADVLSDFGHVQDIYRKQFKKRLFRYSPSQFTKRQSGVMSVAEIVAELHEIQGKNKYWFTQWAFMDWARNQSPERIEIIRAAVNQFVNDKGLARQNVSKKIEKAKEYQMQRPQPLRSARSVTDLYCEFQDMILAD